MRSDVLSRTPHAKSAETKVASAPYEPTEQERSVLAAVVDGRQSIPPMVLTKLEAGPGFTRLSFDHADQSVALALLANALGTGSTGFAAGLLEQIAEVVRTGADLKSKDLDFMVRTVRGIGPRDETEALLAAQMAAIHNATMIAARRLNNAETIPDRDSASNAVNKLARTFAAQVETLKKYRSSGEQTIKVQHVTVNEGGQAIVGNVQQGYGRRGTDEKTAEQSHEPGGEVAAGTALLGHVEADATAMPSTSGAGQEGLPLPRGKSRSTKG